jgi:hypothetical protein
MCRTTLIETVFIAGPDALATDIAEQAFQAGREHEREALAASLDVLCDRLEAELDLATDRLAQTVERLQPYDQAADEDEFSFDFFDRLRSRA